MRILILGGTGMLGHRLWINLSKEHETWITVRGGPDQIPDHPEFPKKFIRPYVDALMFDEVIRAIADIQPHLVINCIGLIKQIPLSHDPLFAIQMNSMFPHRISLICRAADIRMIHISTDCVFSGRKGHYMETDQSDAEDLYGRTKYLGEVAYPHTITLRTSIIGRELKTQRRGLVEWFLSQRDTISGYKKAVYTGFTTDEISRIILQYIIPQTDLSGVYHVSSEPISKYDLLMLVNTVFERRIKIVQEDNFFCDRSLDSTRFRSITGYTPPTWEDMIGEMAVHSTLYEEINKKS